MTSTTRHLLVIGAQRCGTTYLHHLLDAHPSITMARPFRPEPKVFLSDDLAGRGREWYLKSYFSHATDEQVLGEKSTSYLDRPDAVERAAAVLGDPLILVQLRDPVERAVSHWRFSTSHGLETRPLAEALQDELDHGPPDWDRTRTSVSPFEYIRRGRYATSLQPWQHRFGDDLTVAFYEDLVADPGAIGDVYARLGVDPDVRPAALGEPVNASERPADGSELPVELLARVREAFAASDSELATTLGRALPWNATMG